MFFFNQIGSSYYVSIKCCSDAYCLCFIRIIPYVTVMYIVERVTVIDVLEGALPKMLLRRKILNTIFSTFLPSIVCGSDSCCTFLVVNSLQFWCLSNFSDLKCSICRSCLYLIRPVIMIVGETNVH